MAPASRWSIAMSCGVRERRNLIRVAHAAGIVAERGALLAWLHANEGGPSLTVVPPREPDETDEGYLGRLPEHAAECAIIADNVPP
jgi:hypothetical protein